MRTIKFRAWDESQKYMAIQGTPDLEAIQSFFFHFGGCKLMQSTGLVDKNSVEIYENDIVRKHNYRNGAEKREDYIVVFDYGGFCLKTIKDNEIHDKGTLISFGNFEENGNLRKEEIVGNVYENPELL